MTGEDQLRRWMPWLVVAVFTEVFATPWCGVLFDCGCRWVWAGGVQFCNIHRVMGAHCPWCSHGWFGFDVVAAGSIIVMQGAVMTGLRRRGWGWLQRMGAGIVAFFPASLLVGWAFAVHDHYPLFLHGLR